MNQDPHLLEKAKRNFQASYAVNTQVPGSSPGRGATEHKNPQTKVCGLFRFLRLAMQRQPFRIDDEP